MDLVFERLALALDELSAETVDSRRVFHGRGQSYPGLGFLTIDLYDPVLSITLFEEAPDGWEAEFIDRLKGLMGSARLQAVLLQRRYLAGAPAEVIVGTLPERIFAQRGEQRFHLKLGQRQNSGFFLDMEPGRAWLAERSEGNRVLTLFSYTCAFSVVALGAGAELVVNADMSRGALSQGRENHRLNDLPAERVQYISGDILKSWGRIRRPGLYNVLIIDPPSYQPGSFVARKDYVKVARRMPQLLEPGAEVLACMNAPEMGVEYLKQVFVEVCPDCRFVERLSPSADFPDTDPERQLKLLVFRYSPSDA